MPPEIPDPPQTQPNGSDAGDTQHKKPSRRVNNIIRLATVLIWLCIVAAVFLDKIPVIVTVLDKMEFLATITTLFGVLYLLATYAFV